MKLIEPNVEYLEQGPGLQGVYNAICKAAATCYKSEAKAGENAKTFVDTLIKNGHTAMLEFGTVYLTLPIKRYSYSYGTFSKMSTIKKYQNNPYSEVFIHADENKAYVTTNYRVIVENKWKSDLDYMALHPEKWHPKRFTAKFTISIGIGREFLRHRRFSFANESTRWINYSKDKVGNQCTFIIPSWSEVKEGEYSSPLKVNEVEDKTYIFGYQCFMAEKFYMDLLSVEAKPQQAREVLPLCTKSELCMCGFEDDWRHFFDLRMRGTTGAPHPDAKYIATKWWELLHDKLGIEL